MDYFITPEEIYMSCTANDYDYINTLDKIKKDARIMEYSEGYYICRKEDKEALENEYGFKLIPVHPDDFIME